MQGNGGFSHGSGNTRIDMYPTVKDICEACSFKDCPEGCKESLNEVYD